MDRNIIGCPMLINSVVALRKESVDRNSIKSANSKACITSLSARRAWIEMVPYQYLSSDFWSRSPQGERG